MKNVLVNLFELGLLFLALFYTGLFFYASRHPSVKHVVHEPHYGAIVRLVNHEDDSTCSGTVVAPDTVLTARHCVVINNKTGKLAKALEVRPSSNEPIGTFGKVFLVKQMSDQALLRGDFHQFEVIKPSNSATKISAYQAVVACGYPQFRRFMCQPLIYKANDAIPFDPENPVYMMVMTAPSPLVPGMSGGPVFNSDGELIAINIGLGQRDDGSVDSFISPIYDLQSDIAVTPKVEVKK